MRLTTPSPARASTGLPILQLPVRDGDSSISRRRGQDRVRQATASMLRTKKRRVRALDADPEVDLASDPTMLQDTRVIMRRTTPHHTTPHHTLHATYTRTLIGL